LDVEDMTELLVLGFDGLDYERYRSRSAFDIDLLYSPVAVTGTAWTSLYTGDSLSSHGVRDTWGRNIRQQLRAGDWTVGFLIQNLLIERNKFHTYESTPSTPFWEVLNDHGVSTNTVNLPVTYPARSIDGVQISGFPRPKGEQARGVTPPSVTPPKNYYEASDIIHRFMDPYVDGHGAWRPDVEQMGIETVLDQRREYGLELLEYTTSLPRSDVTAIQWSFVDRIGHVFGITDQTQGPVFDLVDELIDRAVETIDPEALVVVSDHGFEAKDHTQEGVLIHDGLDLPELHDKTVTTHDVAPTICEYFGTSMDCDGVALQRISTDRELEATGDYENMRGHLKDLGYLE
jgi:predicted AlkP superfamily phosphohydrolase/phosphomutase